MHSNVIKGFSAGKRRIGAYGVSGWISGKNYSTSAVNSVTTVVPIVKYFYADVQKFQILEENTKQAGIYRWINNISGKSYIGSSKNLRVRLLNYYNILYIERELSSNNSRILQALKKYGYSSFSLEILEYCEGKKVY